MTEMETKLVRAINELIAAANVGERSFWNAVNFARAVIAEVKSRDGGQPKEGERRERS
jgi:hypothetical protein